MSTEEIEDELPEALNAAMAADGERLIEELRLLEEMPQVRLVPSSVFDRAKPPGLKPQLRGVSCKLRCCRVLLWRRICTRDVPG